MTRPTLVYGFGPYQEFNTNITSKIISLLPSSTTYSTQIFDVDFKQEMFESALNSIKPSYILGLGQCRNGNKIRIESRAINNMSSNQITPINHNAPQYLETHTWQLPISNICEFSQDAGTYVCNYSMWVTHNWAMNNNAQFAFIHIPFTFDPLQAVDYISLILKS